MTHQTSPDRLVGRDILIEQLWRRLDLGGSIRFTAERRVGKTSVMQKMSAESGGRTALYIDLERVDSPIRFVEVLAEELKSTRTFKTKTVTWLKSIFPSDLSVSVPDTIDFSVKFPEERAKDWRALLETLLADVCGSADTCLILLLDELPYMLQKIHEHDQKNNTRNALEILDLLRAMRQKHDKLQMVFAGSVGLHHVLKELKGQRSASQPINDLTSIEIEPLAIEDAMTCARGYCNDYDIAFTNERQKYLAIQCNRIPFYMDRILSKFGLEQPSQAITNERIDAMVRYALHDDNDPWEMRHFKDRLPVYYTGHYTDTLGQTQALHQLAQTVLDCVARHSTPRSIEQVFDEIKAQHVVNDKELIIDLLADLAQDHYLSNHLDADNIKRYAFKYHLIQQWWLMNQGLTPIVEQKETM
jgi:hypothetical protein